MSSGLENILDELIATVRSVPGIVFAPDDPPSQIANHPAGVVWVTQGRAVIGPPELVTYHHGIRIALLTAISNIAIANQRILPQIEPVIEAVYGRLRQSGYTDIQNIEQIEYTYGPVQWGDVWYFGALIDLGEVKIQRAL